MEENTKIKEGRVYFPNLNGLRAIGAFIVMIGHIEFLKLFFHLPAVAWFPIPGKIGVTLFFALSGFLITSLLLRELQATWNVQLKKFYVRRILRIWPLYYLIVILSLLVFNKWGFIKMPVYSDQLYDNISWKNMIMVFLILPNFTGLFIPYADQRWSIVIEEQFYLIQPLLVKLFKKRRFLFFVFLLIILSSEIVTGILHLLHIDKNFSADTMDSIASQLKYLGCIAVGCMFSILYFERETALKKIIFTKTMQLGVVGLLITCLCLGKYVYHYDEVIDYRLYALLFAIVVYNASQNPQTIFRFETPVLNFLGKISYGVYMYHPLCIGIAIATAMLVTKNTILQNVIIYPLALSLTIFISWFSYQYFESFFLRIKSRFKFKLR